MSDDNTRVVWEFLEEVVNKHDPEARPDLIAVGYMAHFGAMPALDHESWKPMARAYFTAFPDLELTIEDEFADGDKVTVRWTWTGTHKGDLMSIPATGKLFATAGMGSYRVVSGQIAEESVFEDMLGVFQQLGALTS